MATPQEWFQQLAPITRVWLSAAVVSAFGARLQFLSPYSIMLNWAQVLPYNFQIWRLASCFGFFGAPSFGWLIQMFMLARFVPAYEDDPFPSGGGAHRGNIADTTYMLIIGAVLLLALGTFMGIVFLASPLFFMVIYLWSRRHPEEQTSFYMFRVPAAYLPWVMVGFAFVIGDDPVPDLLGIAAGHLYYFVQQVLPDMETPLKGKRLFATPAILYRLYDVAPTHQPAFRVHAGEARVGGGAPLRGHQWGQGNRVGG